MFEEKDRDCLNMIFHDFADVPEELTQLAELSVENGELFLAKLAKTKGPDFCFEIILRYLNNNFAWSDDPSIGPESLALLFKRARGISESNQSASDKARQVVGHVQMIRLSREFCFKQERFGYTHDSLTRDFEIAMNGVSGKDLYELIDCRLEWSATLGDLDELDRLEALFSEVSEDPVHTYSFTVAVVANTWSMNCCSTVPIVITPK